jgi:hypothetical protein
MEEMVVVEKKKKTLWIILGAVTLLILAGAALVGGRLLGKSQSQGEANLPDFKRASELPAETPELVGMVKEVSEGGSLFVQEFTMNQSLGMEGGTGGVVISKSSKDDAPSSETSSEAGGPETFQMIIGPENMDGPTLEVVISPDTKIYKDITQPVMVQRVEGEPEPEIPEIVQQVEPGDVSEIGPNTMLTIWGERRGDRVIADMILYQNIAPVNITNAP